MIGDENFGLSTIRAMKHYGCLECYDAPDIEGRYCVDFGGDPIFYDYDKEVSKAYGEEELKCIPYSEPHFVIMVYTSENRVKSVLRQDNFPADIYIDNDHGLILPIGKFIQQGMPLE